MKEQICMITTVHSAKDTRIFHKEARSLAKAGYAVTLIAQHDKDEIVDGVKIISLSRPRGRLHRIFGLTVKVLFLALKQKAALYHLHDPELLPVGLLLKILGRKKIIYDIHEDYGRKILSKEWIAKELRTLISRITVFIERLSINVFDYAFAADSNMKKKFNSNKIEVIANYPPLSFMQETTMNSNSSLKVIYAGGIARERGYNVMLETMKCLEEDDVELHLMGKFSDEREIAHIVPSRNILYHGFVSWQEVNEHLINADIGLFLLQPTPSYLNLTGESIIKLFEYMSMKLPVVISDFPLLRPLITEVGCGICVDPANPQKVAEAIRYLQRNPTLRKEMGEKGRRAVMDKYNWENEREKLVAVYQTVLGDDNGNN